MSSKWHGRVHFPEISMSRTCSTQVTHELSQRPQQLYKCCTGALLIWKSMIYYFTTDLDGIWLPGDVVVHQVGTCNSSSYSRSLGDSIIALHSNDNRRAHCLGVFPLALTSLVWMLLTLLLLLLQPHSELDKGIMVIRSCSFQPCTGKYYSLTKNML